MLCNVCFRYTMTRWSSSLNVFHWSNLNLTTSVYNCLDSMTSVSIRINIYIISFMNVLLFILFIYLWLFSFFRRIYYSCVPISWGLFLLLFRFVTDKLFICNWVTFVICNWPGFVICNWVTFIICNWVTFVICKWLTFVTCNWLTFLFVTG